MGDFEYVALRLIRRFVLRDALLKHVEFALPKKFRNQNFNDPGVLAGEYLRTLETSARVSNARILEIGIGSTNGSAYALAAQCEAPSILAYDRLPYFDSKRDGELLQEIAAKHGRSASAIASRVRRVGTLAGIGGGSIDIVLSNSVLEHVTDPDDLIPELFRVLAPGGVMLHRVDYRDHFFKYPYHFLTFRRRVWDRWLDPGDLPRWRLYDHLAQLGASGFKTDVIESWSQEEDFQKIQDRLCAEYDRMNPELKVSRAVLLSRKG